MCYNEANASRVETVPASERNMVMKIGLITDCHAAFRPAEDNKYYSHSFVKFQDSCAYFLRDHVDFVANLGDAYQSIGDPARTVEALQRSVFPQMMTRAPFIHVLGNNDVVDFTKADFLKLMRDPAKGMQRAMNRRGGAAQIEVTPPDTWYYSFVRDGWKFIVLDTNYDDRGESYEKTAYDCRISYLPPFQMAWLEKELNCAEPVIIFTHGNLDIHESPLAEICRLANAGEVREILEKAGNVKLVLQGHDHFGGFSEINGIPYVTLHGTILNKYYPDHCSCAVMEVGEDCIDIRGYEDQPSYRIPLK